MFIEKVFPDLVEVSRAHGTCHPDFVILLMGKFIYDKHAEALSDDARALLTHEELKKDIRERPVCQWGSTILTNPGHLENIRARVLARRVAAEALIAEKEVADARKAMQRALDAVRKVERDRAKKISERIKMQEAQAIYNVYKDDQIKIAAAAAAGRIAHIPQWKLTVAPKLKSAYIYFDQVHLQPGAHKANKKEEYINALELVFPTSPLDLDFDNEDEVVDSDEELLGE